MTNINSQKQLIRHLKNKDSKLTDNDISEVISGLRRFVVLAQKIYTQPQAQFSYKNLKIPFTKQSVKTFVVKTTMDELDKVKNPDESMKSVFKKFVHEVTKGKKLNGN